MARWIKLVAGLAIGAAVVVLAIGTGYEMWSRHRVEARFPPIGKLVDIGGRRLQIDCRGEGTPVVVFESGLDASGSLSWYKLHDDVARITRACAYSRAGILWSDAASGTRDGAAIARDLHALLTRAGERPPYVLVGHSMGGPYAAIYVKYYGADVAGLVLVDPSHPEQREREMAITHEDPLKMNPMMKAMKFGWSGVNRMGWEMPQGVPDPLSTIAAYRPVSRNEEVREYEAIGSTFAEVAAFHELGDRPLVVLSGAKIDFPGDPEIDRKTHEAWVQMHVEQASWSSRGRHEVVPDAGHRIQTDQPEAVTNAVRSVIALTRGASR